MNFNLNLNDNSLLSNGIFNNGEAGRVENVTLSLTRKGANEPGNLPDVKFNYTDGAGGTVNDGYYRFAVDHARTNEENEKSARLKFGRLMAIASCVIPENFQFPDTTGMTPEQIENVLLNTIEGNATPDKKVNIFVNYGRKNSPSKYLRVRNFNFIEKAGTTEQASRLRVNANDDNMVKLDADAPVANNTSFGNIPQAPQGGSEGFWGKQ